MPRVATIVLPAPASTLSNFPVLVAPDSSASWDNFWPRVTASGGDIRVYLDDLTECAREVVSLDKTAMTGEIHVKVPSVAGVTQIHIHVDGASADYAATDTYGRNAVWSDYDGVYHLQDFTTEVTDSSGNQSAGSYTSVTEATGQIGEGAEFDGYNSREINLGTGITNIFSGGGTVSAWMYFNDGLQATRGSSSLGRFLYSRTDVDGQGIDWYITANAASADEIAFIRTFSTNRGLWRVSNFPPDQWMLFHTVYDDGDINNDPTFYIDAVAQSESETDTPAGTAETDSGNTMYLGNRDDGIRPFAGTFDEVRFRTDELSADWISYEHANQSDPGNWYFANSVDPTKDGQRVAIITLPAANSALTDFPVLLSPNGDDQWDSFWATVNADGGDIRCYDQSGNEIAREVVSLDLVNKTGEIWVKVPSISSTDTTNFSIHTQGGAAYGPTEQFGRNAVWSDYVGGVWHFEEDPSGTAPQMVNSTGNGRDGTTGGLVAGDSKAGQIGNALDFESTASSRVNVGDHAELDVGTGDFTFSCWINPESFVNTGGIVHKGADDNGSPGYLLRTVSGDAVQAVVGNGTSRVAVSSSALSTATWYHVCMFADRGGNLDLYINGSSEGSGSLTSHSGSYDSSDLLYFGEQVPTSTHFDGLIDEPRLRKSLPENIAAWAAYEHNNQSSPSTFYRVNQQYPVPIAGPNLLPYPVIGSFLIENVASGPSPQTVVVTGATETDSAAAVTATAGAATVSVTGVTETDTAAAVTATAGTATVSVTGATEADSASIVTPTAGTVTVSVTGATETDTAGAVGTGAASTWEVNDTDGPRVNDSTFASLTIQVNDTTYGAEAATPQSVTVTGAVETNTAGTVTPVAGTATVSVTGATESDTAGTSTPTAGVASVGVVGASETDTAASVGASSAFTVSIGGVTETDAAASVTPVAGAASLTVVGATETDAAGTITPSVPTDETIVVVVASETDTAGIVTPTISGAFWVEQTEASGIWVEQTESTTNWVT